MTTTTPQEPATGIGSDALLDAPRRSFEERLGASDESRRNHPGLGCCGRCHLSWGDAKGHDTMVNKSNGVFPLCEDCWGELTPVERMPFYRALWISWQQFGQVVGMSLKEIEAAVLAGK